MVVLLSTLMRRNRSGCCARVATGQNAVAPPRTRRKSRRLIMSPRSRGRCCKEKDLQCLKLGRVRKPKRGRVEVGYRRGVVAAGHSAERLLTELTADLARPVTAR